MELLFLGNLGGTEIIVILALVLLLFGGKKIPELMRGLGKGVKEFKRGAAEVEEELANEPKKVEKSLSGDDEK